MKKHDTNPLQERMYTSGGAWGKKNRTGHNGEKKGVREEKKKEGKAVLTWAGVSLRNRDLSEKGGECVKVRGEKIKHRNKQ